jgi:hypothetical protein
MYYLRAQWYRVESGYPRWVEQWYPGVPDFAHAEQVNLTSTTQMQVREWVLRTRTVPPPGDFPAP